MHDSQQQDYLFECESKVYVGYNLQLILKGLSSFDN